MLWLFWLLWQERPTFPYEEDPIGPPGACNE